MARDPSEGILKKLHGLVWDNNDGELDALLSEYEDVTLKDAKGENISLIDGKYRGTSALGLAAQLGRRKCTEVLLKHWADTLVSSDIGYFPLQEATSLGDKDLMEILLLRRHEQLRQLWKVRQPALATALRTELPDFFLEMDWHFRSWIPFLARFCPADRCRIWKRGNQLRVDSTIMGVEMQNMSWKIGNVSFIFNVEETESRMLVLDHDRKVFEEIDKMRDFTKQEIDDDLNMRLNTQIYMTKIRKPVDEFGNKKVQFVRKQGGLFGLGGDKEEQVGVYQTNVYDVPGIEFVTRYRKEHLVARESMTKQGKEQELTEDTIESLDSDDVLAGLQEFEPKVESIIQTTCKSWFVHTPSLPRPERLPPIPKNEYFNSETKGYLHVGRSIIESGKTKKFNVSVWMADNFPLTVHQLMPFFELMTVGNKNFEKLNEFISMELPPGFPVRIEIPIFAFLLAQITFLNFTKWEKTADDLLSRKISESTNNKVGGIPKPQFAETGSNWFKVPNTYEKGVVLKSIFKDDA